MIKKIGPSPHQSQAAQQQLSAQSDLSSTTRVNHLLRLSSPWWRWWFQELHRHLSSMLIRARGCSSFLHSSISYLSPCSTVLLITSHFPCTFSTVLAVSAASPASVRFQLAPPKKKKRHLHDWHLTLSIWPSCSSSDFLDLLTEPLCIPYKDEALRAVQHLFFSMPAAPMLPWLGVHCPEARTSPLSLHVYLLYDRESFDSFISPAQLRLFHDVVRCALVPAVSCQLLRQRVQFCRASPSPQGRL